MKEDVRPVERTHTWSLKQIESTVPSTRKADRSPTASEKENQRRVNGEQVVVYLHGGSSGYVDINFFHADDEYGDASSPEYGYNSAWEAPSR